MLEKNSDILSACESVTHNEPIFSILISPYSTEITKLLLNNNISICLCMLFAMTSKVRKKRKNLKINWESGRFLKNAKKAEDLPLYRKTWQVCMCHSRQLLRVH